jgi:pre-mRNA-splicing factor CWC22
VQFFAHLLSTDAISWGTLSNIVLTEEATTSSARIFIKILFQVQSQCILTMYPVFAGSEVQVW